MECVFHCGSLPLVAFLVVVDYLSLLHLSLLTTQVMGWLIKMGQFVAHFFFSTSPCEQKVDVIHSGSARGEASPLGICPRQRIADTRNSVAQDFCNIKDSPPALAHRGRSQQSGS